MKRIGLTLLTLLLLPLPGWSTALNLFVIQRNKNTNEVQYQLHVNDRCHIVSDHPVDAVWHLREVSPETTAPLTDLEQMVYGVTNQQVTEHGVSFDLASSSTSGPWNSGGSPPRSTMIPRQRRVLPASRPPFMGRWPPWSAFMCRPTNGWYAPRCGI